MCVADVWLSSTKPFGRSRGPLGVSTKTSLPDLQLEQYQEVVPEEIQNLNFLSVEFIRGPGAPPSALIGADDGSLLTYDVGENQFVDLGSRGPQVQG